MQAAWRGGVVIFMTAVEMLRLLGEKEYMSGVVVVTARQNANF